MKNKKAFTLIELIVVMAVIGVLVLLAMPKFMGYTEKARLTEIKNNIKQLENASERFYIKEQDWPRASDTPYTASQLEAFAREIKNRTGATVILEPDGKYYEIDYEKLHKYVQKPKDGIKYILQNPVGEVFYLDKLTEQCEIVLSPKEDNPDDEEPIKNEKPIAVISMTPDEELTTLTEITWSADKSTDPDGDNIIKEEWENKESIYSTPGEYIVRLKVQDEKGLWSDWTEKTINIEDANLIKRGPLNLNSVAYFDGSANDYIIKNPINFPTEAITIEFWIRTFDSNEGILSYAVNGTDNEFLIYASNSLRVYIHSSWIDTGIKVNNGEWNHITIAWESKGGSLEVYKNGVLEYKGTHSKGKPIEAGGSLVLGQDQDNIGGGFVSMESFNGYLDEVRIWNRKLTKAEIVENVNSAIAKPNPNLKLYYTFDEEPIDNKVFDHSLNDNYGVINGFVNVGNEETDIIKNRYAVFSGNTKNYIIKNPMNNMISTAFTMEYKIKTTDSGDSIMSYAVSGTDNEFLIYNSSSLKVYINAKTLDTGVKLNDNRWHHVIITWESSTGELTVYVDGVVMANKVFATGATIKNNGSLVIAQEQDAVGGSFTSEEAFNGCLDDIRLWNRALSKEEIDDLVKGTMPFNVTGLILFYDFENIGFGETILIDKSDSGNDAKMVGNITIE